MRAVSCDATTTQNCEVRQPTTDNRQPTTILNEAEDRRQSTPETLKVAIQLLFSHIIRLTVSTMSGRALSVLLLAVLLSLISRLTFAFSPPLASLSVRVIKTTSTTSRLPNYPQSSRLLAQGQEDSEVATSEIWLPQLRRAMAVIGSFGALETGYLTYQKLFGDVLCGLDGASCNQVLNGPYSYVPFTDIPLSAMGLLAYLTVAGLAVRPLVLQQEGSDDSSNRIALTAVTTAMGTFSIFLMTLLFGVLETTCPYCIFSAACSIMLAMLAWIGGCLPENSKVGAKAAGSSFLATTVGALVLLFSGYEGDINESMSRTFVSGGMSTTLLASSETKLYSPPPITTESSPQSLVLADKLQALDAKMYGAYWCSHCFDQKEAFGKAAFSKIQYLECSKDGVNSQYPVCKANDVPGYPTWQIQGKLYPGEQELDELEDLVKEIMEGKK